jgi:hypothetical protein
MVICKISYTIVESDNPGGIINLEQHPNVGDKIQVGELTLEILEVIELLPPRGNFHYLHVTCKIVE